MERADLSRASTTRTDSPTSLEGGGTEQRALRLFQIWRSQQNGWVYDPKGLSPCLGVGKHSGVSPKIIIYGTL